MPIASFIEQEDQTDVIEPILKLCRYGRKVRLRWQPTTKLNCTLSLFLPELLACDDPLDHVPHGVVGRFEIV
jgi:hypothetical protein